VDLHFVLGSSYTFGNGLNIFGDFNFTQAIDKVIKRDDPFLQPDYLNDAGFTIGQRRTAIPAGILTSWDDVYMSTPQNENQNLRRVGYYDVVDFDGDGVYNSNFDNAPFPRDNWLDGSLTRLRAVSISYDIPKTTCEKFGLKKLQVFANGNNLFLWSDMPDDREFNSSGEAQSRGDYPTLKRFNVGLNMNF